MVALVGPNGSGKTTLMSMAAGLLPVTEGTVEAAGDAPARRLDRIGFVAQDAPLANLDPLARREFLSSMFAACQETGSTVLYSSHAVAEAERVCDYLVVLRAGRVRLRRRYRRAALGGTGSSAGRTGWPGGGWPVISQRSAAGQTTALVRCDDARLPGPGLRDAAPAFDEAGPWLPRRRCRQAPRGGHGMTSLIWRQHRGQALWTVITVTALCLLAVSFGLSAEQRLTGYHSWLGQLAAAGCPPPNAHSGSFHVNSPETCPSPSRAVPGQPASGLRIPVRQRDPDV